MKKSFLKQNLKKQRKWDLASRLERRQVAGKNRKKPGKEIKRN